MTHGRGTHSTWMLHQHMLPSDPNSSHALIHDLAGSRTMPSCSRGILKVYLVHDSRCQSQKSIMEHHLTTATLENMGIYLITLTTQALQSPAQSWASERHTVT